MHREVLQIKESILKCQQCQDEKSGQRRGIFSTHPCGGAQSTLPSALRYFPQVPSHLLTRGGPNSALPPTSGLPGLWVCRGPGFSKGCSTPAPGGATTQGPGVPETRDPWPHLPGTLTAFEEKKPKHHFYIYTHTCCSKANHQHFPTKTGPLMRGGRKGLLGKRYSSPPPGCPGLQLEAARQESA